MRLALLATTLALAATGASGQSVYPGEDALALAGPRYGRATPAAAAAALERILERLQVPAPRRERYAYVGSATLQKSKDYFETQQLAETVLIVSKSVRIGFASNVLVIAGGDVDISHASGTVVVAGGSFRLSHETDALGREPGGVYVAKGTVELSFGVAPIIYARRGGKTGYSGPVTAYNTDVNVPAGVQVLSFNRGALFRGEPVRPASPPHVLVNSGESIAFTGERCTAAAGDDVLDRMLPYVRREADCPRVASASVRCLSESGSGATARAQELWTFQLCSRKAEVRADREPNHRQMALVSLSGPGSGALNEARTRRGYGSAGPPPKPPPSRPLSDAEQKRVSLLFKEAIGHSVKGELVEARAKYLEVIGIAEHVHARRNLESLERQIRRADVAVAAYADVIDRGLASARTYADRGLILVNRGDVSRGLKDLDRAVQMNNVDPSLALDRARGYVLANRPAEAQAFASEVLAREPRLAAAYEARAWPQFLLDRPEDAYRDAFSSLVEAQPWSPSTFAAQAAGNRVLVGYLALRQSAPRARATEWLREWRPYLQATVWPDALLLFLLGEIEERDVREAAASRRARDGGTAEAEAFIVLALDETFGGSGGERNSAMQEHFRSSYSAGRTLPWILYNRIHTPGQKLTARASSRP